MSTLSITLKIAVEAPMPNASVITATTAKPGLFASVRTANRTSCRTVSIETPFRAMSDRELYGARDEKFVKAGSNSSKIRELMLNDEGSSKRVEAGEVILRDRKSTRLNSSHVAISYAVFC